MKKELIIVICFIAALCNSGYSGDNVNYYGEDYQENLLSDDKTVLPISFADSLYSILSEKMSYRIEKDTTLWKFMSRDYLHCAPFPLPSGYSEKDSISVVYDYNGVPVARRIFTGDDSLVVIVHSKGDSQILISLWDFGNCSLIQKGRTHSFYVNEDVDGTVSIVGNECIAIGHPRCSFGLYKIGLDSMPCIYYDTLTSDTERYVGFYPGDHAGRFGVFAAKTRKAGTSGWEQLFLYYWDGNECRPIPIPGIGDDAIKKNHVSECSWLEPQDNTDQSYVELLIKKQYIEQSLPQRVYCFDGQKWSNTSEQHKDFIVKKVNDWWYRDSYLIMFDSAFAEEWMSRNADTINANARRIRYYGYKMSHTGYIGKLFPAGLYYFCRENWDSAFTFIKILNTPWGENDNREISSAKQLQTVKEYLISCGDMTSYSFADSLFTYIRTIQNADLGEPIKKKIIGRPGVLPHPRLKAFVDSLWPYALDEVERLRKYQMEGQKIIMAERTLHDSLSILAENLTHRPSAGKRRPVFQRTHCMLLLIN